MKIFILANGFTMVGKPWEIKAKLKEYQSKFDTVEEWIQSCAADSPQNKARLANKQRKSNWD
jgi:hypothetical protein